MKHSIKDIFSSRPTAVGYEEDLYKVKKVPYKKDDMRLLENLFKYAGRPIADGSKIGRLYAKGGFGGSGFENNRDQRVMFKMSYPQGSEKAMRKIHEKYLRTYMPQENKAQVEEKPVLFGTDEDEYETNMTGFHHKCIISPENQNVDLELLSREFIKRVEVLTGYKLYWRGAIHNDTAHRHAHLCINGRDKDGKKVWFPKEMIRTTMRETLSYVATLMVGERTEQELEAARKNMISAKRWTKLDETLETYGEKISMNNLPPELANRIAFLSELKLAEKHDKYYTLKSDWKDVLVSTGRYNTFFDEWQKSGGNLELYAGGTVSGRCERVITFDKDEAWNDAVIVNDGEKMVYVPVWQLSKENLVGKKIEISGGSRALSRQIKSENIHVIEEKEKARKTDLRKTKKHGD